MIGAVPLVMCKPRLCVLRQLANVLRFWRESSGSSLIEYSLAVSLMIALTVVGIRFASNWIAAAFSAFSP